MRAVAERTEEDVKAFNDMCEAMGSLDDRAVLVEFLQEILTANEVTEIARRWRLLRLLHQGRPQREIAASLHLSLCKITRGSKELKKDGSIIKKILDAEGAETKT